MPPVAVISVWPAPAQPLRQRAAPALVELREHVVEQQERRRRAALGEQLGLREQEREHGQPLLSLRAVAAQVAPAGGDPDVVQVRPEPGRAALEILVEPRLESLRARRLGLVEQLAAGQPELGGALGERRPERRDRLVPRGDEQRPRAPRRAASRARPRRATTLRTSPGAAPRFAAPRPRRTPPAAPARAGKSRPSARSKYARRAAGPPLTTTSRSGVKTSVATSARSCSAARSGAPFSSARFASPGRSVSSISSFRPPRSPASSIRAASAPKRTSCASLRLRGEKPCVPTCSASSRFVLPAPFSPTASTSPGSRASSSEA